MDLGDSSSSKSDSESEPETDPKYPPTFVHVCPDVRENTTYLRQFLEKGFRMTVQSAYLKLQTVQLVIQAVPDGTPEQEASLENAEIDFIPKVACVRVLMIC